MKDSNGNDHLFFDVVLFGSRPLCNNTTDMLDTEAMAPSSPLTYSSFSLWRRCTFAFTRKQA
jgi:hypothetical protein